MTLQIFFMHLALFGCMADEILEVSEPILQQQINFLSNEVLFLKGESQSQKETIIELTKEVEDLKDLTNKITTDIPVQNEQMQEHRLMSIVPLILVATGGSERSRGPGFDYQDYSQVVDVSSTKSCFSRLAPYPIKMAHTTGNVLNGSPLICGGEGKVNGQLSYEQQSSCYMHEKSTNTWKLHGNMNKKRKGHSTALTKNGLWISGGFDGNENLASMEFIFPNGSLINGPNMTDFRNAHCMVTLHDQKIMILGGYPPWNRKSVLIFNPEDNTFISGPSLLFHRANAGCTLFRSPLHENRPVVLVAGGTHCDHECRSGNTAEVFDYTNSNEWEQIGSLPTTSDAYDEFYGATALPSISGNGAYLQCRQYFYELSCTSSSCDWNIMEQELKRPVQFAVMMYLPTDYTNLLFPTRTLYTC